MRLTDTFSIRVNEADRRVLLLLARRAERKPGDLLRLLLRREAQRAGLLKKRTAQFTEVSEAEVN